jgi:hypothetical protein
MATDGVEHTVNESKSGEKVINGKKNGYSVPLQNGHTKVSFNFY